MRVTTMLAVLLALSAVDRVGAQQLTSADSATLRLATMAVIIDTLALPATAEGRIWVSVSESMSQNPEFVLSRDQWQAIIREYPGARQIDREGTAFECPPGVEVRLPGSGCPIRDDGVVIHLGRMFIDSDTTTRTSGYITRSEVNRTGKWSTWSASLMLLFARTTDGWVFRRIVIRGIT